jgi:hypothetical protein
MYLTDLEKQNGTDHFYFSLFNQYFSRVKNAHIEYERF